MVSIAGMDPTDPTALENLLPCQGEVRYHGPVLTDEAAWDFFERLNHDTAWRQDEVVLYGRRLTTAREVAWHGDPDCDYAYSGTTKKALPWTPCLLDLKALVEARSGAVFNSCLINLYHNGNEGMAWHSDDEKMLEPCGPIASLSLGAERRFVFRHKSGATPDVPVRLAHGSLLVMRGTTQIHWRHSLPKSRRVTEPRINLTFRRIVRP